MPEFFNVFAPDVALQILLDRLRKCVETEIVPTHRALGRITAEAVLAAEHLPAFPRSTMDGYAVRARDTFGASESLPAYLEVVGEVRMGRAPDITLATGQAVVAYTGGMLAHSADAVVMVENTQQIDATSIEVLQVLRPVAPGENVIQVGEDVRLGEVIVSTGSLLRPQDIGGLLALGITQVKVHCRPRVAIVSTGDEIVTPETTPAPGQIRDINTYTIAALVEQAGGVPVPMGLVKDDYEAQRQMAVEGLSQADMLVFSAGSSVSSRDMTVQVLQSLGPPGVLVHGIAHRPGKPTIMALIEDKPAFGLPGNPVSAMIVFRLLVRPTLYALTGCTQVPQPRTVQARLTKNIPSVTGREDHVQVRLSYADGALHAEPVFGKSNLIYTLIRADGVVVVPLDQGGLYAGAEVPVQLYD
jgi:molybdopterin molybdotransferase